MPNPRDRPTLDDFLERARFVLDDYKHYLDDLYDEHDERGPLNDHDQYHHDDNAAP